ncbi:WYL domain-containing protein [Halalkalibacter oceani]|uniref:WYL domain-containing protein n=1 Tax=Halalkalibacter oceani TaxID=1653776 RepID=A0A9X2IMU5_9BACI|nr:hypothetical protein [Halalkalibacter oceani]MCM3712747.1 hypothetical protein [Halalkalibacter oceani]
MRLKRILEQSIEKNERIQIIYMAANGELSQRDVTVKAFNETHVIGYCHYRRQTRMFKRDNILAAAGKKETG